ncbi:MAG: beta-lactamase [Panacagrimonas sp.]|jgi:CubicO group peptidase (beta-lactamase class C family)|nr:serine hydrolase domain-containing protein [Panacagrimonas sp.]MCC2655267.1 beta-lactamase [Panacagrimonas sp.]
MSLATDLDTLIANAVTAQDLAGVVLTVGRTNEVLYESAAGRRSLDAPQPMTPDTVMFLASMTKAITGVLAMQLVECGRLELDAPAARLLPELDRVQVLEGFDEKTGEPRLRAPRSPVTLRNLLTHSSGFAYEFWNADIGRYLEKRGVPSVLSGTRASFAMPLAHDPDTAWSYGQGIDVAGRLIEEAAGETLREFARKNLFEPLRMDGTSFRISPEMRTRLATMHARTPDGGLAVHPIEIDQNAEQDMGGHSVYGTAPDYLRFLRMILGGGALDGARVLKAQTVATLSRNHLAGDLRVRTLKTVAPGFTHDCNFFPDIPCTWGLSWLINTQQTPEGRSPGSLAWAGICNNYCWVDPQRDIAGVMYSQLLPFFDPRALALFRDFERTVYRSLG